MKLTTKVYNKEPDQVPYREAIVSAVGLTAISKGGNHVRVIQPTHPDGSGIFSVLELCFIEVPHFSRPLTTKETFTLIDVLRKAHNHAQTWNKQKGLNLEQWLR